MQAIWSQLEGRHNFVFVGEAGSGKSEIAISFAKQLAQRTDKTVHFFDLDMTKPLFRSRDVEEELSRAGVQVHYQEQFMDAPTLVGGVMPHLRDENCLVVLDVGGDYIGARSIGGFAPQLNKPHTAVFYVINSYRPWSDNIDHIDGTLGKILGVSHVQLGQLMLVSNPNNGLTTTAQEFLDGHRRTVEMVSPYMPVSFACVREELADEVAHQVDMSVMPLHLSLVYPWLNQDQE